MPNRTVLVIEDDPAVARATQKMLTRAGFEVIVAESGEAGELQLMGNEDNIDTVLIDYTLPGANGIETFERLHGLYPHLQFFLMSGFPEEGFPCNLLGRDLSGFIQKPFMGAQLLAALTGTVQKSVQQSC